MENETCLTDTFYIIVQGQHKIAVKITNSTVPRNGRTSNFAVKFLQFRGKYEVNF